MLDATWTPLLHIYTLIVILCSWVFFRAKSLDYAFRFFGRLFGSQEGLATLQYSATKPLPIIDNSVWIALALGVIFSLPVLQFLRKRWSLFSENRPSIRVAGQLWIDGFLFIIGVLSIASITNLGISASIYGGF